MSTTIHEPVLLKEILNMLRPQSGGTYVDATINGGGHALAIAERIGPEGKVIGIDLDKEIIAALKERCGVAHQDIIVPVHGSYADLKRILEKLDIATINGILFDLGFSSFHVDRSGRGFSFQRDEPLDMRYDACRPGLTAERIVNEWDRGAIEQILMNYGEERFSRRIAGEIVRSRQSRTITTTGQLVEIIERAVPRRGRSHRINPATRTFQALRIAVNDELATIAKGLAAGADALAAGGRIAAISFHSLEDRIVKEFFRDRAKEGSLRIITPKPLKPSEEESVSNPRARSAKLRVAERIA